MQKLEESTRICRKEGFKSALVQNLFHLGQQAYWQADFSKSKKIAHEGVDVSSEIRDSFQELFNLAVGCLSTWGVGDYAAAFDTVQTGLTKAKQQENRFIQGRLTNSLGWFHRDLGDFYGAVELHEEGLELARQAGVFNVEISALIDLGHDYLMLKQLDRARTYLEPTLERVEKEGIGSHRWRWMVRSINLLAEVHHASGRNEEALRLNTLGLEKAEATSSQKYLVHALTLRGRIAAEQGDAAAAGVDFERAYEIAEKTASPTILYPVACTLAEWYAANAKEREAHELYKSAKKMTDSIAADIEDAQRRKIFERSPLVRGLDDPSG